MPAIDELSRDFTVATFVVWEGKVLLLWHRKLQKWLPPGGHIEPNELPDEAAVREVREEAGIDVTLIGDSGVPVSSPRQLIRPAGVQLEPIHPGHEHIDLIYFARPCAPSRVAATGNAESEAVGWFAPEDLASLGVIPDVRLWADRALQAVQDHR